MDVNKLKNEKLNEINKQNINNLVEDYDNNSELRMSLINVDSRFRNKIPQNIIESRSNDVFNKEITITENSNEVKIYYKNNYFNVGDRIILKNIKNTTINLKNSIFLLSGFNYFLININNHGFIKSKINNFKVDIKINDTLTEFDRMIGNIPLNSLIGIKNIYLLSDENDDNIPNNKVDDIINRLSINRMDLIKNYFFVKLPFEYLNENKLNNDINFDEFQNLRKIISIDYLNIGGIQLGYLNSDYPINTDQFQHSQEITKSEGDYFYFNSSVSGLFDQTIIDKNIYVGKVINTIEGYPNANDYTIDLKKSFTNIVRIELVSCEIPYIEFNVKNNINETNNIIHWKYLEDGDNIYSATIPEGNYTPNELTAALKESMNKVERISSTINNQIFNIFEIQFNSNSQELKFSAFKNNLNPNSLTFEKDLSLGSNVLKLNIKQVNNFVNIGDKIIISGSNKIGDIPASIINAEHTVFEINQEIDTYSVIIPVDTDKNYDDINITGSGGQNVKIQIPARVSFLFNQQNSIGGILGFKNVGSKFSITPYQHIISNFDNI